MYPENRNYKVELMLIWFHRDDSDTVHRRVLASQEPSPLTYDHSTGRSFTLFLEMHPCKRID